MARLYQMYSVLQADQTDDHLGIDTLFKTRQAAERYLVNGTENWPLRIVPVNITVEVVNE